MGRGWAVTLRSITVECRRSMEEWLGCPELLLIRTKKVLLNGGLTWQSLAAVRGGGGATQGGRIDGGRGLSESVVGTAAFRRSLMRTGRWRGWVLLAGVGWRRLVVQ